MVIERGQLPPTIARCVYSVSDHSRTRNANTELSANLQQLAAFNGMPVISLWTADAAANGFEPNGFEPNRTH